MIIAIGPGLDLISFIEIELRDFGVGIGNADQPEGQVVREAGQLADGIGVKRQTIGIENEIIGPAVRIELPNQPVEIVKGVRDR